jgi:RNA polymerase sigma factor (sigma-70 family)
MTETIAIPIAAKMRKEAIQKMDGKDRKRLFDFIRRKVSNDTEAEDILQDVFYMLLKTIEFEPIEKISAWLYRVAENKIIDWYRKRKTVSLEKLNAGLNKDGEDDLHLHLEDMLFDQSETPDELYLRSTVWDVLSEVLEELPKEQKEVFIMNELEDKSFKEISEITGVGVNTLISRKRYAVLYLREKLKDFYTEFMIN